MSDDPSPTVLRRAVLTVTVLDDVDAEPAADGVLVPGPAGHQVLVGWDRVALAVGDLSPEAPLARLRTATLLRTAGLLTGQAPERAWVGRHVRALALPVGHPLHPGPGWAVDEVLGGVLEVGLGLVGLPWTPDGPVPLPPGDGHAAAADWWPDAREHADRMGALAGVRVHPEGGVLRPVGGCDVLTLLATRSLRRALAGSDPCRMRAVTVPARSRGWYDQRRADPAFAGAAWSATDDALRGVPGPLLVTRDEVTLARAGGVVETGGAGA